MPDEIGGSHMAKLVVRPEVIRFLDLISGLSADKLRLEEMSFEQLRRDVRGRSIRELDVRSITGATIIGLRQADGSLLVSPGRGLRAHRRRRAAGARQRGAD